MIKQIAEWGIDNISCQNNIKGIRNDVVWKANPGLDLWVHHIAHIPICHCNFIIWAMCETNVTRQSWDIKGCGIG